jgi:hypothetical protein
MPIEVEFWKITDGSPEPINYSALDSEKKLQDILAKRIDILADDLLLLGREVVTDYGKRIDMLAIDIEGNLTIIELKRDRTPREVVAQAIDYASWVQNLTYDEIKSIFESNHENQPFEVAFSTKFGIEDENQPPEKLNQEHKILIVCSALDPETERIIHYLSSNYNVPVNAVFFRYFKSEGQEYLSRSWLLDPTEIIEREPGASKAEAWNGHDFVVNVDADDTGVSSWEDCVKYGFVSAGGKKWYSQSLRRLFPGARVFAMIPKKGYLGVAEVVETSVPIRDFLVDHNGVQKSIMDVPLAAEGIKQNADDPEKCEYMVRVKWIKNFPEKDAYWVKGMRANQNSAFKLRNKFTLDLLVKHFGLEG